MTMLNFMGAHPIVTVILGYFFFQSLVFIFAPRKNKTSPKGGSVMIMKLFDLAIILCTVIIVDFAFYIIRGPVPPIPDSAVQELRAEIDRLKPYEEFMKDTDVTITYNGCEDIRKRLGLTAGVGLTP